MSAIFCAMRSGLKHVAIIFAAVLAFWATLIFIANLQNGNAESSFFRHVTVDANRPRDSWGKAVGDLNGDGLPDLLVGGNRPRRLQWYSNPEWRPSTIAEGHSFGTDHEIADIDRDGRNDIVSLTRKALIWYRNPDWAPTVIANRQLHDVEVTDLDGDGDLDVVARNQSAFGGSGATVLVYMQAAPDRWAESTVTAPDGEGLKVVDVNDDDYPDIVVNQVWLENPKGGRDATWEPHVYTESWTWPHVFIDTGDINGDGRRYIVLSPAEPRGRRYRLSWFEAPENRTENRVERVIVPDVEIGHPFRRRGRHGRRR